MKKGTPPTLITTSKTLTANDPGLYYSVLNIPFPNGSPAICKINSAFDTVRVKAIPNPSFTVSNTLALVCPGQSATITATGIGTNTLAYIWSSQTGTISSTSQMVSSPSSSMDIYTVTAKNILTSCTASETVYVNSYTLSQEQIQYSKNPICLGDSVKLSYNGAVSYSWSTANNNSFIFVKPNSATDYSLQLTDANGCTDSKFVRINIDKECDIKIYNSVTPNDDNVNDVWFIDNINRFPKNHVSIFNRWGQLVYETNGYDNVTNFWPPKNASNKIFSSTYFYVLDLNNGTAKIKGWIELIR
jgi:gliding motility-associated-like protein